MISTSTYILALHAQYGLYAPPHTIPVHVFITYTNILALHAQDGLYAPPHTIPVHVFITFTNILALHAQDGLYTPTHTIPVHVFITYTNILALHAQDGLYTPPHTITVHVLTFTKVIHLPIVTMLASACFLIILILTLAIVSPRNSTPYQPASQRPHRYISLLQKILYKPHPHCAIPTNQSTNLPHKSPPRSSPTGPPEPLHRPPSNWFDTPHGNSAKLWCLRNNIPTALNSARIPRHHSRQYNRAILRHLFQSMLRSHCPDSSPGRPRPRTRGAIRRRRRYLLEGNTPSTSTRNHRRGRVLSHSTSHFITHVGSCSIFQAPAPNPPPPPFN